MNVGQLFYLATAEKLSPIFTMRIALKTPLRLGQATYNLVNLPTNIVSPFSFFITIV